MLNRWKRYFWICPIFWMGVIFVFSHQSGDESSQLSGGITGLLMDLFRLIGIQVKPIRLHAFIRVLAHFTVFFVLGALWFIALRLRSMPLKSAALAALYICVGYAVLDELHQYFVPNRACEIKDVMVDSAGAGLAIGLSLLFRRRKGGNSNKGGKDKKIM